MYSDLDQLHLVGNWSRLGAPPKGAPFHIRRTPHATQTRQQAQKCTILPPQHQQNPDDQRIRRPDARRHPPLMCTSKLTAYKPIRWSNQESAKPIFAHQQPPGEYRKIELPCGQCAECRLEKSRQWAMRCVAESQLHDENCFVTLTYNDKELPDRGSLCKQHLQKFFDRLRYHKGPFRYYACGEYGDTTQRAHYHACIFGLDFHDKTHFRKIGEHNLYISNQLTEIWGHGNTSIGNLTFETAAYTARYVMKKTQSGLQRYVYLDDETGELRSLTQPFALMSLRSAIGKEWLTRYHADIYNKDYLVMRGKKMRPPKYYDKIYDTIDPIHMEQVKQTRIANAQPRTDNQNRAREKNARARLSYRNQM